MRKILRDIDPITFIKEFVALATFFGAMGIWFFVGEALLS